MASFKNATVEQEFDAGDTVALRPDGKTGGQIAHFAQFRNTKHLMVAVVAKFLGKTVDFDATDNGVNWLNVVITRVN